MCQKVSYAAQEEAHSKPPGRRVHSLEPCSGGSRGKIRPWPPSILAMDFSHFQRLKKLLNLYDLTLACKLLQVIVIVILTYILQGGEMIGER